MEGAAPDYSAARRSGQSLKHFQFKKLSSGRCEARAQTNPARYRRDTTCCNVTRFGVTGAPATAQIATPTSTALRNVGTASFDFGSSMCSAADLVDLGEAGPAICMIDQADDGGHGRTPCSDRDDSVQPVLFRADFVAGQNGFHIQQTCFYGGPQVSSATNRGHAGSQTAPPGVEAGGAADGQHGDGARGCRLHSYEAGWPRVLRKAAVNVSALGSR
jgi:hypothetical protein